MRVLKKTRKRPRLLAVLLCVSILLPNLNGLMLFVSLGSESGLCPHHQHHDETCGYSEGTPGVPCNHEHSQDCYVTRCLHIHTPECYPPQQPEEQPPEQPEEQPPEQPEEQPPEQPEEQPPEQPEEQPPEQPEEQPPEQPEEQPPEQPEEQPPEQPEEQPPEQPEEQPPEQPEEQLDDPDQDTNQPLTDEAPVEPTLCQHQCSLENGCITLVCPHQHNEDCGYVPPTPGTPCQFSCPLCVTGWEWVDEEGYLLWNEEAGVWGLGLPGLSEEEPLTREVLDMMLPAAAVVYTAAGSKTVDLSWSYGAFPDSAFSGTYTLTASLTGTEEGDYVLASGVPELSVLLDLGGGEMYAQQTPFNVALNEWTWEGLGEGATAVISIPKDTIHSHDDLLNAIRAALPKRIYGWSTGDKSVNDGEWTYAGKQETITVNNADGKGNAQPMLCSWGYLNVDWSGLETNIPVDLDLDSPILLSAEIPKDSKGGRKYFVNAGNNTDNLDKLEITVIPVSPKDHIVTPAAPDGTTVNLFDYWVDKDGYMGDNDLLDTSDIHNGATSTSTNVPRTGVDDWNMGINLGHLLLFGDGNIHAGLWNKGAGASSDYGKAHAGTTGIVKPTLEKNYPVINTNDMDKLLELEKTQDNDSAAYKGISDWQLCGDHDETAGQAHTSTDVKNISNTVQKLWNKDPSLDYLFTPVNDTYKRAYQDVQGLFQIDDEGYYYYDMRQNFAEYNANSNKFILYDAPAVERTDNSYDNGTGEFIGERSVGNFLPFNTAEQVFDGIKDGKLYSSERISTHNDRVQNGAYLNHHLGMTVNIDFRQPEDGKINMGASGKQPMTFLFSGDDDVWVYIDDVLVLDLGGIHSEIYGVIDFESGKVSIGQSWKTNGFPRTSDGKIDINRLQTDSSILTNTTTIRKQFEDAGVSEETIRSLFTGDTFTGNTNHTLRMFFLERGNYDSSLAVRFNLQPQLSQQIKKVDQDGKAMAGVEFELYPAQRLESAADGAVECLYTDGGESLNNQKFYVQQTGSTALAHLTTDQDGVARFLDANSDALFNFARLGEGYYILKETSTPAGYRSLPVDIALYYDPNTAMISVANRWSTGAYACSVSNIIGVGKLTYGKFVEKEIQPSEQEVSLNKQQDGLIVAVPMLWHQSSRRWEALYGGNIEGFDAVMPKTPEVEDWREAALTAALHQAADSNTSDWYLTWDGDNQRLLGTLDDLPGLASRYRINNPDGDMRMVYGIIEPAALTALGINKSTAEARYEALRAYVKTEGIEATLGTIMETEVPGTASGKGFSFLNVDQFNRNFRSLVYIPNEQRELMVQKVDQDGSPLAGAEFTLYRNSDCTDPVSGGTGVTDHNGLLVFSPAPSGGGAGHAQVTWANAKTGTKYYLKETNAPAGYPANPTVIPIVVGTYSIYADAGEEDVDDGVSVMAGVGRLTQTMRQYAKDNDVDITLRDITAYMQTQPTGSFDPNGWKNAMLNGATTSVFRSINLHFGMNLPDSYHIDYGLHDADITGQPNAPVTSTTVLPVFVTDKGFIRTKVQQNYPALDGRIDKYGDHTSSTNKDNLGDIDLTSLFSLLNVVVVTDKQTNPTNPTGKLQISKTVTGENLTVADYTTDFTFTLKLEDGNGKPLNESYAYHFWGSDKAGTIKNGGTMILHHDDTIVIDGLPVGTVYTVTETTQSGWYVEPASGSISGSITANTTAKADFINSKNPSSVSYGSLKISKTVTGDNLEEADRTREFRFTVNFTVNGVPVSENFSYRLSDGTTGSIQDGGTISLRHGDTVTIENLPVGTAYTVTEAKEEGWSINPVSGIISGSISGSITANITAKADFINSKSPTDPENPPTDPENPPTDPENPPTDPENPPTDPENPPTDPENPPTDPENPPTDPENPPTDPENPPTDPENPPTDPENPPTDPENPPTDPENPPTDPENPPENPGYPTELPDPNDPDSPEVITIWEEGVPKTYIKMWDPENEEYIYIPDGETPRWLIEVPDTGNRSSNALWIAAAMASLGGLGLLVFTDSRRKKKQ